jgi:hypothetical protein
MIEVDGAPPKLQGCCCEGLLCQQYWYGGELADEADVVWLKVGGRWHQLFFDGGVVHWRNHGAEPEARRGSPDGVLTYPMVDLAARYGLKDETIAYTSLAETTEGEIFSLAFEQAGTLMFVNLGDRTQIRHWRR